MISTLCLASFDLPSHSSSGFLLRHIVPRAPVMLYGPMANPLMFAMSSPISDLIVGTGHGSSDEFSSQNESVIWKVGDYNPEQVRGKVVKLLSCQTGALLGPDLVRNGANCFMGYEQDLLWIADPEDYLVPWADEDAAPCLMPVVASLNALLDGATCGEAMAIERAGLLKNAENTDFELSRSLLQYDHDHSVLYGDEGAKITPRPRISIPFPPPPLFF